MSKNRAHSDSDDDKARSAEQSRKKLKYQSLIPNRGRPSPSGNNSNIKRGRQSLCNQSNYRNEVSVNNQSRNSNQKMIDNNVRPRINKIMITMVGTTISFKPISEWLRQYHMSSTPSKMVNQSQGNYQNYGEFSFKSPYLFQNNQRRGAYSQNNSYVQHLEGCIRMLQRLSFRSTIARRGWRLVSLGVVAVGVSYISSSLSLSSMSSGMLRSIWLSF